MTADKIAVRIKNFRWTGPGRGIGSCGAVAHPDQHPSMSLQDMGDKTLLYCQSCHCDIEAICDGLGITVADLFTNPPPNQKTFRNGEKKTIQANEIFSIQHQQDASRVCQ